jgi:hypothetical protein
VRTSFGISWKNYPGLLETCCEKLEGGLIESPQPRGTSIDAQRRRRWTHNFSTYRYQVSEQSVRDWIEQFANDHRDVAARLLDVVDFYSIDRISGAFRAALAALPGWDRREQQRTGKWRFAGLSRSAGESADAMMHRFRVANGLDGKNFNHLFIHPSQILLEKLGTDDTLVLIDDFVGTGDSVCSAWKESFAELVPGIGKVYLVVVAAIVRGRVRVGEETSITCVPGQELTNADNFFAAQCDAFTNAEKEAIFKYCQKAHKKEPKGYKDCGLVVIFQHRCPNNTLPIFYVENNRWTGLFPRHG